MNQYLSIDIGGSAIKYGLFSVDGEAVSLESEGITPIPDSLTGLAEAVSALAKSYSDVELKGIAVSMPGLIDSEKGFAVHGGALTYIKNCNIQSVLQENLHIPLSVENDGKCAALGELWAGQLKNAADGVVIVLGTGIGGGIIANGKLLRGAHLGAGEFSAIQTCNKGDLAANSFAVQNGVTIFLKSYAKASNREKIDGRQFFDILESGDTLAAEMFGDYCRKIAFQIVNLQNILDPEKFVISGGISARPVVAEMIADSVRTLREEMIEHSGVYFDEPIVLKSELGNLANLYGALYRFLELQ